MEHISQYTIQMERTIEEYSSGLPGAQALALDRSDVGLQESENVVLLTGTTGTVGSEILAQLLTRDKVAKIYAFNRPSRGPSIRARHQEKFAAKGFNSDLLQSTKLVFLEGDTALPDLGLSATLYGELRDSVTLIIHNAWSINLTRPLASFEPLIRGTRNLINMALSSPHSSIMRFLFLSSFTAAQSWDSQNGHVPEEVLSDAKSGVGSGYGESKFVTERILSRSGLRATTLRLGQICGKLADGAWSTSEWIPMVVKSSVALGALPRAAGVVSWVPLDAVAGCVLDVAFSKEQPPPLMNIWHPRPIQWNVLMEVTRNTLAYRIGYMLPFIDFPEWVSRLERGSHSNNIEELKKIPAIKVLANLRLLAIADRDIIKSGRTDMEHFGFRTYATQKACVFSPTLRDLQSIGKLYAEQWVKYWCAVGFIGETPPRPRL